MLQAMIKQNLLHFLRWLDTRSVRQDYLLCLALGTANALAMPPVYLFPVLLLTFPLFIRMLDKALTTAQAFFKTFLFFFAFHVAGLYWISAALFVDIGHNWWVLPFSLSGLPALMAVYPALAVILWHRMAWQGTGRLIALIVLLALTEWLRGWVFTGFPWNSWGYAWTAFLPVMQSVALFGVYGLSLATLIFAALPVFFARNYQERSGRVFAALFLLVMGALIAWGFGRLATTLPVQENPYIVRIVQPNIQQTMKWDPELRLRNERKLWAHTVQQADKTPGMVVWPETAIPLIDTMDVRRLESNATELLPNSTILAAGVLEVEMDERNKTHYFNRLSLYNNTGRRLGHYEKFHLVPFGEFLPFQEYWPVTPVAFANGSLTRGAGVTTIALDGVPAFSPLICYEVIFPGASALNKPRPQWILNITNDAWYGRTSGPYQHLAITRTRAIEEGLPLIRAANTGISAAIDPFGRILQALPLGTEGIIDQALPQSLKPTLFARFGNGIFLLLLAVLWGVAWGLQRLRLSHLPQLH
ncbi:MAG: acyltransferase [Alphaproteobacteria bacterium]|nr:acyltransferase [Alphaproteobacteria bacterium]